MSMRLIMENFRAFREGEQAYEKYVDMTSTEKEVDAANAEEKEESTAEGLGAAHKVIFGALKGMQPISIEEVPVWAKKNMSGEELESGNGGEEFLKAVETVGGIEKAVSHIKEKNLKGADKHLPKLAELHKQLSGGDASAGEDGIEKGDSFEYTSKTGKESAVQVVDPENKHGATVAQKIDPESCEPQKNTQFASNPEKFAAAVGDPIDQCDADGGGDSKIANLIAQKLKSTGLDKYIMKITKRNDLLELEKVILNLALDSSSPIKAADLLKVVTQLKADIQAKVKGSKDAKGAKEA